jgi:Mannosyltransferase (PIG-V)
VRSRAAARPQRGTDTLRVVLLAFVSSRALIWAAGIATALVVGLHTRAMAHDPHYLTQTFAAHLPDYLVSPAARFDSAWYLSIAKSGYLEPQQAVFFPLFPAAIALLGSIGIPQVAAGVFLSCGFAVVALWLLCRLVELDFDEAVARNTVWIVSWLPVALYLSAVYTEALFLLLAIAALYWARLGRWWIAGLAGLLAAATRNSGVLLVIPLLVLYLYGPRGDRPPRSGPAGLRPRYEVGRDVLSIALVPIGLVAYLAYLHFAIGDPLAAFSGERFWHRSFEPLAGVPLGAYYVIKSIVAMVPGLDPRLEHHLGPLTNAQHLVDPAVLVLAALLLWYGWRRLPLAYTVFAGISLAFAVSVPAQGEPLRSLPRFTLVIFPLWISLGLWATEKRRVRAVLAVCAPLIVVWTYLFTAWLSAA